MATGTIIGNYRIEEFIGRGGMGIVYRGQHLQLPREVAIKSIDARNLQDLRRLKTRFIKEAYIQSQLDHPGIVKIYDYIVDEQTYYIIMEYVDGRSLADLCSSDECPLPVARGLDIFEQILTAIAYAQNFVYRDQDGSQHRGLIHRDLKPANILITSDDRVKVTDFGIVKLIGADNTDPSGAGVYGTPHYVSPEQARGIDVDQRSDIYSLGIIFYEMLAGTPPFGGKDSPLTRTSILRAHVETQPRPPSEINKKLTPEIDAVILRAIEKRPDDRFASATEFLRAVRHARGHDTDDLKGEESYAPASNQTVTRAGVEQGTERAPRENYDTQRDMSITQPIGQATCGACGATADPDDERCRKCGHEMNASPATVKITRQEAAAWERKRLRGLWLVFALAALGLLALVIVKVNRRETGRRDEQTPIAQPSPTPTPVPASALVEIKAARVDVDSNFNGYNATPLTDNETDVRRIAAMRYNAGNWASAETQEAHWIELGFDRPTRVAALYVYWGFDRNRFMPSRRVELQTWDENGAWRTLSVLEPGNDHDRVAFNFAPLTTTRLRILQPPQQGPTGRPFVMWVREVKIFGIADNPATP